MVPYQRTSRIKVSSISEIQLQLHYDLDDLGVYSLENGTRFYGDDACTSCGSGACTRCTCTRYGVHVFVPCILVEHRVSVSCM